MSVGFIYSRESYSAERVNLTPALHQEFASRCCSPYLCLVEASDVFQPVVLASAAGVSWPHGCLPLQDGFLTAGSAPCHHAGGRPCWAAMEQGQLSPVGLHGPTTYLSRSWKQERLSRVSFVIECGFTEAYSALLSGLTELSIFKLASGLVLSSLEKAVSSSSQNDF